MHELHIAVLNGRLPDQNCPRLSELIFYFCLCYTRTLPWAWYHMPVRLHTHHLQHCHCTIVVASQNHRCENCEYF